MIVRVLGSLACVVESLPLFLFGTKTGNLSIIAYLFLFSSCVYILNGYKTDCYSYVRKYMFMNASNVPLIEKKSGRYRCTGTKDNINMLPV